MNTLMLMAVLGYFPHSVYQAYMCSSGARGYHAFREALEVGRPRHTLLVTNVDIRDIDPKMDDVEIVQEEDNGESGYYDGAVSIIQQQYINVSQTTAATSNWDGEDWSECIPPQCTTLTIVGCNIQETTDRFLSDLHDVKSIDLSGLSHVTFIGSHFLAMCHRLKSIDLTPLSNVTTIDGGLLYNCTGLLSIDLTPLRNLISIGPHFLSGCASLTTVDTTTTLQGNITVIPSLFLSRCYALQSINLSACSSVGAIGSIFLGDCRQLRSITLPPALHLLTRIESFFLRGCSKLESINLTGFINLSHIGDSFLMGCRKLTSVSLESFGSVVTIGILFMSKCEGLVSIDVRPLARVQGIGLPFLAECTGLAPIDLEGVNPVVQQAITAGTGGEGH